MKKNLWIILLFGAMVSCSDEPKDKPLENPFLCQPFQGKSEWTWDYVEPSLEMAMQEEWEGYTYVTDCYEYIDIVLGCDTLPDAKILALMNTIDRFYRNQYLLFLRQSQRRSKYNQIIDSALNKYDLEHRNPELYMEIKDRLIETSILEAKAYSLVLKEMLKEDYPIIRLLFVEDSVQNDMK